MSKDSPKMKSWQVLAFARKYLGASTLYAIFGKKMARAIDYWCQDPLFTARPDGAYDPIWGVKKLLQKLDDHGHYDVVRACISYLASGTSAGCAIDEPTVVQLKPTIGEEILADFRAVAALQIAIENGENAPSVQQKAAAAVSEIDRTVAFYLRDK